MAQLIKLKNYVSRYEWNVYRYPSQYIRIKQESWQKLIAHWENEDEVVEDLFTSDGEEETSSRFSIFKPFMKKKKEIRGQDDFPLPNILPETKNGLKKYFLNKLFPFQLKWASSTVSEISFMDQNFMKDEQLKFFLQRFPDTYLLMYYPIFNIKKAPIDGEIVLISPIGIEIIYMFDEKENIKIIATDERTWLLESSKEKVKILSPLIALKRTEKIVNSILNQNEITFPVTKTVISKTNPIVYSSEPYQTKYVDKQNFESWFQEKRQLVSTLKNRQLKVVEALLKYCQTTSVKRPEWEEEESNSFVFENEV